MAFFLSWKPNRQGTRPVRYEVYGSDEKGFSVSKTPYDVWMLGTCPANHVGSTAETKMVVVSADEEKPNMNRAYYRVVAVDAGGTSSGSSDYAEMPRPYVYTRPPTEARVGRPYAYRMKTIRSIGSLLKRKPDRNATDMYRYAEKEAYRFTLLEGPGWLGLDADRGLLSGIPTARDLGDHRVDVCIDTYYPNELSPWLNSSTRHFSKRDEKFHRRGTHTFTIRVAR